MNNVIPFPHPAPPATRIVDQTTWGDVIPIDGDDTLAARLRASIRLAKGRKAVTASGERRR